MIEELRKTAAYLTVLPHPSTKHAPAGGFFVWCRLLSGRHARLFVAAASRVGVALLAGEAFYPPGTLNGDNGQDCLRLCFSSNAPAVNAEGIRRLIPLLQRLPDPSGQTEQAFRQGLRPVV